MIRVHAQVEILNIGPAVADVPGLGATCAVRISTGEDSFLMYEVWAFTKHEDGLEAAVRNAVRDRISDIEDRYRRHVDREALRDRTPKTFNFELDMNEAAFKWQVEEQKKHPV